MANDLTLTDPAKTLSLPAWLARLAFGTVQMPGRGVKKYLPAGLTLTAEQRAEAERRRRELAAALDPASGNPQGAAQARAGILAKMILAYPIAGVSEKAAQARAEAYLVALDDAPAWALNEAVRRWHRGQAGEHNYSFSPPPAVLRAVVLAILRPYRAALDKIETALAALPLEETMREPAQNILAMRRM